MSRAPDPADVKKIAEIICSSKLTAEDKNASLLPWRHCEHTFASVRKRVDSARGSGVYECVQDVTEEIARLCLPFWQTELDGLRSTAKRTVVLAPAREQRAIRSPRSADAYDDSGPAYEGPVDPITGKTAFKEFIDDRLAGLCSSSGSYD